MSIDAIQYEIENFAKNKHVVVVSGFSGLGYANPDKIKLASQLRHILLQKIYEYGRDNIVVVAGATADGIGVVYEIAKLLHLTTLGIVSECARQWGVSKYCDKVVFVPDPEQTWKVLSPSGHSYMVNRADSFYAFGGGDVTVSEVKEALSKKIRTYIYQDYQPDERQVAKRREKNATFVAMPLRNHTFK